MSSLRKARFESDNTPPPLESLQLKIGGMSCSFCVNAIERGIRRELGCTGPGTRQALALVLAALAGTPSASLADEARVAIVSVPGIPGRYCAYGVERRPLELDGVEAVEILWKEERIRAITAETAARKGRPGGSIFVTRGWIDFREQGVDQFR